MRSADRVRQSLLQTLAAAAIASPTRRFTRRALAATLALAILSGVASSQDGASTRRLAGHTLDEWRERMQQLDLQDPGSAAAVPGLIELVQSNEVPWFTRRQAALTLGRLGAKAADAIPVLTRLIDDTTGDRETAPQLWSIKALGWFGPTAHQATGALAAVLNDDAAWLPARVSAAESLARIGTSHGPAVAELLTRLQHTPVNAADRELLRAVVESLALVGPPASPAVPGLIRVLDDSDANLRREACTTLGGLGASAEPAFDALVERLAFDNDAAVRDAAATAIGKLGATVAGETVASLLTAEDDTLRLRAVQILSTWGPAAQPWSRQIEPLWEDASAMVRIAALRATWAITHEARAIAPKIAQLVGDPDRQVRRQAVTLLTSLGPAAESARPHLEELLKSRRNEVRTAARKGIEALRQPTQRPLP